MESARQEADRGNGTRYLGIDPGLNRTGYALVERSAAGPRLLEGGVIRSRPGDSLAARVHEIGSGMREVLEELKPQTIGLEQVFSFGRNPKTALLMAHVRGALLMTAVEFGVPVVHYSPTQVKRLLTGSGRASKQQIQQAVRAELRLKEILEPNDVADASAVALCVYHCVRFAA